MKKQGIIKTNSTLLLNKRYILSYGVSWKLKVFHSKIYILPLVVVFEDVTDIKAESLVLNVFDVDVKEKHKQFNISLVTS